MFSKKMLDQNPGITNNAWSLYCLGLLNNTLIFQFPIYLEPSSQLPIYQVTRPLVPNIWGTGRWGIGSKITSIDEVGGHVSAHRIFRPRSSEIRKGSRVGHRHYRLGDGWAVGQVVLSPDLTFRRKIWREFVQAPSIPRPQKLRQVRVPPNFEPGCHITSTLQDGWNVWFEVEYDHKNMQKIGGFYKTNSCTWGDQCKFKHEDCRTFKPGICTSEHCRRRHVEKMGVEKNHHLPLDPNDP